MNYDVLIIGAGASGLYCACRILSESGVRLGIIDSNDSVGKKLLMTGAGRCNISNYDMDPRFYMTDSPDMLASLLRHHDEKDSLDFFRDELGVLMAERDDKLCYPATYRSDTVVNAMRNYLIDNDADFIMNTQVYSISRDDGGFTVNGSLHSKTIVIAVGGASYSRTGSNGSILKLAAPFTGSGDIAPLYPALVPLKTMEKDITSISGARAYCDLNLYEDSRTDKVLAESSGEILFTQYGVSGICVLDISGYAIKAMTEGKRPVLSVNLLKMSYPKARVKVETNLLNFPDRSPSQALNGLIRDDILAIILGRLNLTEVRRASDLSRADIDNITECMTSFKLTITGSLSFDNAQITTGGIMLSSVNDQMELKSTPGLFICGEALNCNGICGGYNLQFCWSSASAAAEGVLSCLN